MQGLNPLTMQCIYSTPCGYCSKWDKKCDKKIGGDDPKVKYGDVLEDKSGTERKAKQAPTFPKCPHCGQSLKLLGGNAVETYFRCEFCGKPYILNVFTEKLVPEGEDDQ